MVNVTLNKWDKHTIVSFFQKGLWYKYISISPKIPCLSPINLLYHYISYYIHILRKNHLWNLRGHGWPHLWAGWAGAKEVRTLEIVGFPGESNLGGWNRKKPQRDHWDRPMIGGAPGSESIAQLVNIITQFHYMVFVDDISWYIELVFMGFNKPIYNAGWFLWSIYRTSSWALSTNKHFTFGGHHRT